MGLSTTAVLEAAQKNRVIGREILRSFDEREDYQIFLEHCLDKAGSYLRSKMNDLRDPGRIHTIRASLMNGVDYKYKDDGLGKAPENPSKEIVIKLAKEIKKRLEEMFASTSIPYAENIETLVTIGPTGTVKILLRAKNNNIAMEPDTEVIPV